MRVFIIICLIFFCHSELMAEGHSIQFTFVEYNCENLFNCYHDTLKNDNEFLPDAQRKWNFPKYWKKLNDIARVIHQCGENTSLANNSTNDTDYHLPDIVTLCEVENDSTMFMLTRVSLLKGGGYRYIMTDSPDQRGIDVAMLYNPLTFKLCDHAAIRIKPVGRRHPTRDILYAKGMVRSGDTLHIFAIHAPSRSGGQMESEPYRMAVMKSLLTAIDSIRTTTPDACIIVAGDFNDYSDNKSLVTLCKAGMKEVSQNVMGRRHETTGVTGTYKYQGEWESLDHILLSPTLAEKASECYILDNAWMLTEDTQGGFKPFRTFLGPIYKKGVSDHLPLVLHIKL